MSGWWLVAQGAVRLSRLSVALAVSSQGVWGGQWLCWLLVSGDQVDRDSARQPSTLEGLWPPE